jgi:hypothetical protein
MVAPNFTKNVDFLMANVSDETFVFGRLFKRQEGLGD